MRRKNRKLDNPSRRRRPTDSELVEQSILLDKAVNEACAGPFTDPSIDEQVGDPVDEDNDKGTDPDTGT